MKKIINEFLQRCKQYRPKIAVIGDSMIDEYYYVNADRVSPEFPIPVMKSHGLEPNEALPGGAANVYMQFKHFDVDVDFISMIDRYGQKIFENHGINTDLCACIPSSIPIKRRLYHGDFPLCRWDIEEKNFGLFKEELDVAQSRIFERYRKGEYPVAIFSDYDKGVFSNTKFQESDTITIVDPKNLPLDKWEGCTIFKPNEKEAEALSGEVYWQDQCDFFMQELECQAVVITQGGTGVVGKVGPKYFEYKPYKAVKANSVIGAGDMFVAVLALTQAHAMDIVDGVKVAFEAGSLYVQRKHNQPVTPQELLKHIDPVSAKFVLPEDLRDRDYKLVFTNGVFDLLHTGHTYLLENAKSFGNKLVVALNSDQSVKKIKGNSRPIVPLEGRKKIIASLEFVDFVVVFDEETPYNLMKQIQPDIIVKGGDYEAEDVVGSDIAKVEIIPLIEGQSTTKLVNEIRS